MRLIDADEFKEIIVTYGKAGFAALRINKICELIDSQTTAYDADKVVEQIRKLEICRKCLNNHNSVEICAEFCDVGKKLAIIKSGGIE